MNIVAVDHTLDDTLLALADGTRRAILARLSDGDARVTTLAEPFRMSLNSVSKHIRVLERAQLVQRQVRGREHVLSLNIAPLEQAAAWLVRQQQSWAARLAALDRVLERRRSAASTTGQKTRTSAARRKGRGRKR
jgi:DNA-binding transcriptional ArsR family regulator